MAQSAYIIAHFDSMAHTHRCCYCLGRRQEQEEEGLGFSGEEARTPIVQAQGEDLCERH